MGKNKKPEISYEGSWQDVTCLYARPTGTWRDRTPVINSIKCCQCGWCSIYCPAGCVVEKEECFEPDLKYCKGCGVCARECPVSAIQMVVKG
jgi:2-oxoacid:acceptor oxidoreductase delta subunit (pyruvate/2-ketoisovalerate family)